MFRYLKKLFTKLSVLLLLALILTETICYAATWEFKFPTYVTDNTGTTRTYYPVILGYQGQDLIDGGYISSSGNDTNMQIGTSSIDYMLSTTNVTCILENLPAYGKQTVDLYTGYSLQQSGFPIIIGDSGNITVSDAPAMEMGDNFTLTFTNAILTTDNASDKNLWYKENAFELYIDPENSGTVILDVYGSTTNSVTLVPNGAGSSTAIDDLVGAATHWQATLSDDTDTSYVETEVGLDRRDSYAMENVVDANILASKIANVKSYAKVRSTVAPSTTEGDVSIRTNGSYYDTPYTTTLDTYVTKSTTTYTTNPNTGNYWSWTEINALESGLVLNGSFPNYGRCTYVHTIVTYYPLTTLSISGISSGEYNVVVSANTTLLTLTVGGTSNSTAFSDSINNNTEDILIMQGNSFVKADSIELKVDGVPVATYEPTTMLSGTTLEDETGTNDGTIIWGTNDNIIISYGAMVGSGLVEADVEGVASFDMPEAPLPTGWFARGTNLSSLPFYDSFNSVALSTGQSLQTIYFLGVLGIAIGLFLLVVMYTRSALLAVIACAIVLVGGAASTVVPLWLPFVVIIVQFAIMYLYKQFAY